MHAEFEGFLLQSVDWGLRMLDESTAFKLREAERTAKQQRKGQWVNWTPPATPSSKLSGDFTGTVTEIVSGDCIVVSDSESGDLAALELLALPFLMTLPVPTFNDVVNAMALAPGHLQFFKCVRR